MKSDFNTTATALIGKGSGKDMFYTEKEHAEHRSEKDSIPHVSGYGTSGLQKNPTGKKSADEIRLIERAKEVLIEYLKMTEAQAHRYIEKQAMDMRITRREVAESIIKTYEH